MPLRAGMERRLPGRREMAAVLLAAVGLAVFLVVSAPSAGSRSGLGATPLALICVCLADAGLALIGWGYSATLFIRLGLHDSKPAERPGVARAAVAGVRERSDARHPGDWELILPGILVIGGGLLVGYCERRAYEALARQYDSMDLVFHRGMDELNVTRTEEAAREVIEQLGQEALVEHVHWLIIRRTHPFELIIGG